MKKHKSFSIIVAGTKASTVNIFASIIIFILCSANAKSFGLAVFGAVTLVYSAITLMSSLVCAGLPEATQQAYAHGILRTDRVRVHLPIFFVLGLTVCITVVAYIYFSVIDYKSEAHWLLGLGPGALGIVSTEITTRIAFQRGSVILPQIYSSAAPIVFWALLLIVPGDDYIAKAVVILAVVYATFGVAGSIYCIKAKIRINNCSTKVFYKGFNLNAAVIRIIINSMDVLPLLALSLGSQQVLSGVFAFVSRLFGPLQIISNSFASQMQRRSFEGAVNSSSDNGRKKLAISVFVLSTALIILVTISMYVDLRGFEFFRIESANIWLGLSGFLVILLYKGSQIRLRYELETNMTHHTRQVLNCLLLAFASGGTAAIVLADVISSVLAMSLLSFIVFSSIYILRSRRSSC